MKKNKLDKKIRLYKVLGAEQFQKVVFAVEKLKFKTMKKVCPNFIKHFDKFCDKKQKRELRKCDNEEDRKQIVRKYKFAKMAMRKEMNTEKNRNYHMDPKAPTEIYQYLEWNKKVHKKGLIKNSVVLPLSVILITMGFYIAIPILIYEIISTAVNFECVNIQNYNICRYKKMQKTLEKREEKNINETIEKYGEATEVIHNSIEQTDSLPSFDEIIANIKTVEQAQQMKEYLKKAYDEKQNQLLRGKK